MTDTTAFSTIELEISDGIAQVTLNRPDRLNAFNVAMLQDLVRVFDLTDADDAVLAVIVTGAGRAFCAGADLDPASDTFNRGGQRFTLPRDADGGGIVSRRIFD